MLQNNSYSIWFITLLNEYVFACVPGAGRILSYKNLRKSGIAVARSEETLSQNGKNSKK